MTMKKTISSILALALAFSLVFLTGCGGDNKDTDKTPKTEKKEPKVEKVDITLAVYEKIEPGMSYKKVKKLLGGDGEVQSEAGEKGSDAYVAVYKWNGMKENTFVVVVMRGDMVTSKTQVGLE